MTLQRSKLPIRSTMMCFCIIMCGMLLSPVSAKLTVTSDFPKGCNGGPTTSYFRPADQEDPVVWEKTCIYNVVDENSNGTGIWLKTNDPKHWGNFNIRFDLMKYENGSIRDVLVRCYGFATLLFEVGGYTLRLHPAGLKGSEIFTGANFSDGSEGYLMFTALAFGNIEGNGISKIEIPWHTEHGVVIGSNMGHSVLFWKWEQNVNSNGEELDMLMEVTLSQIDNGWFHNVIFRYGLKSNGADKVHGDVILAQGALYG